MKLIQTKDYLLLVDEEAEISKAGTLIYENDTTLLNITGVDYKPHELDSKIIAYYPLTKEAKELDLPLLPNLFKKEIDETILFKNLGHECFIKMKELNPSGGIKEFIRIAVEFGYKSAQSDKQFSLEDMKDILEEGLNWFGGGRDKEIRDSETWFNHYIQSLSTQQLPKEFIPEYKKVHRKNSDGENIGFPVHDSDEFKTITNSEGKEELVGTYKY